MLSRLVALRPAVGRVSPLELRLSTAELGVLGEELGARFLLGRGWVLIGRNVAAAEAELDIVAIDGDTLVIVEVKAGWCPEDSPSSTWRHRRPRTRVSDTGIARRLRAAARIAKIEGLKGGRVDVVEVIGGRGPNAHLVHHAGVTASVRRSRG